ncbi:hypothetical protein PMA3_02255 [Pseudomonas silesiensis]|uniref:Uncharacterized protein n=1 Tax=Pseudomonas silesiensis TaxID=1853130 RepID=A0A191YMM3_9PSED|nr:hypothetical protein PMA3_02255 [Pseudomonas silesiensis]
MAGTEFTVVTPSPGAQSPGLFYVLKHRKFPVGDIGGLNGDFDSPWQALQPLLDRRLVVGNRLKQIQLSLKDHQLILGDIDANDWHQDRNWHCH